MRHTFANSLRASGYGDLSDGDARKPDISICCAGKTYTGSKWVKEVPRCSDINESSLVRESVWEGDDESCERVTWREAAVNTGLSDRRASRRSMYSSMRGLSLDMVGKSLQVLNDRWEHVEQRERLQRLHSGQELLRRNINEKRFIDESTSSNRDRDRSLRWPHGQKSACGNFTGRDAS